MNKEKFFGWFRIFRLTILLKVVIERTVMLRIWKKVEYCKYEIIPNSVLGPWTKKT